MMLNLFSKVNEMQKRKAFRILCKYFVSGEVTENEINFEWNVSGKKEQEEFDYARSIMSAEEFYRELYNPTF